MSRDFLPKVSSWSIFRRASDDTSSAVSSFSKICEDISSSSGIAGINDTGDKLITSVVDTAGKFSAGINDMRGHIFPVHIDSGDTDSQFSTGVSDAGGELQQVSTTPLGQ